MSIAVPASPTATTTGRRSGATCVGRMSACEENPRIYSWTRDSAQSHVAWIQALGIVSVVDCVEVLRAVEVTLILVDSQERDRASVSDDAPIVSRRKSGRSWSLRLANAPGW